MDLDEAQYFAGENVQHSFIVVAERLDPAALDEMTVKTAETVR